MATMEKTKSRQPKKKSKSKRTHETHIQDDLASSSISYQEVPTSPSHVVEEELADAAKDSKSSNQGEPVFSDTEEYPLLSSATEASPIQTASSASEEGPKETSSNDCHVDLGAATVVAPEEKLERPEVAEDILIEINSPVHKLVLTEQKNNVEVTNRPSENPYSSVSKQLQKVKTARDVEEGIEAVTSGLNAASLSRAADMKENKQALTAQHRSMVLGSQAQVGNKRRGDEEANMLIVKPFSDDELSALYSNQELDACMEFVSSFVEAHLRPSSKHTHPLHDLLVIYLRSINRLVINHMELEANKKESKEKQSHLWILETTTITESGECQDGNPVSASHVYQMSKLNRPTLSQLRRILAGMRELVNITHSLDAYSCEAARLQIEGLIQNVAQSCPELLSISENSGASLTLGPHTSNLEKSVMDLRTCIAILFSFQRRPMRDERFVRDTQDWLSRLVAILVRIGNWQDHMFLLNHVLRCPAGVGQWASNFVQTPVPQYCPSSPGANSPFDSPYIDHVMVALATIILPIRERAAFLEQFRASLGEFSGTTDAWIVLDSDGEDEEGDEDGENSVALRENDLVALLNQVAIGPMFQYLLCVEKGESNDVWTGASVTPQHFLRLLSFSTVLVRLLRRGLEALAVPRYRQLSKRLGRLVRHTVQYATDLWQILSETFSHETDPAMGLRLQVEYDAFLVRATNCIHSSRHLGAWQFLAILPYNMVSLTTLWQLWYALHEEDQNEEAIINCNQHEDWEAKVYNPSLRAQLEDRLTSMPDSESYYLLTTFANMALSRHNHDWAFIRAACLDLLQIGFLSLNSQEACSKSVRILLSGLVAKHPPLLSEILTRLSENFSAAGKLSLYLYRELPLNHWQPVRDDVTIITRWLLRFPLTSPENNLARYILTNLNWGFNYSGDLFLVPQLHRDVAILVLKAALQYVPDATGSTAMISEGLKQVSSMVRAQTAEQAFLQWVWDMFAKLRLHLLDQSESTVWSAMVNLNEMLHHVPDLEVDSLVELVLGVKQGHSVASFAVVAITQVGHSVPQICMQGFNHLCHLLSCGRYEAVLTLLRHIMPLFLECVPSLLETEKFQTVLNGLLQADRTYVKMAKNLIVSDFPGPIINQFGNMIQSHLHYFRRYNQEGPHTFVSLWLQVLTNVQDWARNQGALYLLDIVLRTAFFDPESKKIAYDHLRQLFQTGLGSRQGGALSSIMSWVSSGTAVGSPLLPAVSCPDGPWFAFFALEIEQEELEDKTGLWKEVQKELASMTGKPSVDSAIKKACCTLKRPAPPSTMLSIYRWSQQALDTPMDHPLLPLFWQKFFLQFLSRVPTPSGQEVGSVGPKFFEGMVNLIYLKRIKKRLQECKEFYWAAVDDCKTDDPERRTWLENTSKMIWTLGLWLEEPRLHEPTLYLPALPPLYNAEKLATILQGDRKLWLELMDYKTVLEEQKKSAQQWESSQFRAISPSSPSVESKQLPVHSHNRDEGKNPVERTLKRLQSYDTPAGPPALKPFKAVLPPVKPEAFQSQNATFDALRESIRIVLEYAQLYALRMAEHNALDCSFLQIVPSLYSDVKTEVTLQATCQSEGYSNNHQNIVTCAGPATIRIKIREARVSDRTEHMINQNRNDCDALITRAMQPPPLKVCASSVQIEQTIKALSNEYLALRNEGVSEALAAQRMRTVGVELFYHLVSRYNEDLAVYPPTKQLFTTCLESLGQVFISGEECECERLLACMVQFPRLAGLLGPHFTPTIAATPVFLIMYKSVVDISVQPNADLSFVLLSKFDIGQWLSKGNPNLSECDEFINYVGRALTAIGPTPAEEKQILHEMFCNHIRLLLKHKFPLHFNSVLNLLLKTSESQSLCPDVWYSVINVILTLGVPQVGPGSSPLLRIGPNMNPGRIMEDLRLYAVNQKLLQHQELLETVALLASHFNRERLQYGLYGLYPKYRVYVDALAIFLGIIAHSLVVSTLQNGQGVISNKLVEQLWPSVSAMFFPWIAPYWTDQLSEPTAAWIQQLTDDRSVLPPWIVGDASYAQRIMGTFVEVMRFVLDTLPASSNLLGYIWQFYVSHFAHTAIKEHTLTVVHTNLLTLPWMRFWPAPSHLDLMLKVVDQYLPDCHAFLGAVFIEIAWTKWLAHASSSESPMAVVRLHTCLLHLFVKLANEPSVRQSGKILSLLVESRKLAWHLLDAHAYEPVVNWYVMSVDPRSILRVEDQDGSAIDSAVIYLLQVAAGYTANTTQFHSSTLRKRQMFVRSGVKVLVTCASRYKSMLSSNRVDFFEVIQRMLDDIEIVVAATVPQQQQVPEAGLLLTELLGVVNQPPGSALGALALESCVSWLSSLGSVPGSQRQSTVVVPALLKVVGSTVNDSSALGGILEATLESYFYNAAGDETKNQWSSAVSILQPTVPRQPPTEEVLITDGNLLSLHGLLLLQLRLCRDIREEAILLSSLMTWLNSVRPTEQVEAKLTLLWCQVLYLAQRQVSQSGDRATAASCLHQLVQHASAVAEHKAGGWGLLSAIGIGKQLSVTPRCRLLCRFLCAFVSAQLPESKVESNLVRSTPNCAGSITNGPSTKSDPSLDIHPTADALKNLASLEGLLSNKLYAGVRSCIESSVIYVRNPENSLHNASEILQTLAKQLYTERYLHASFEVQRVNER
ncbi:ectopic P granules protein 5 homolog isoform X2 [Thrips palmi]|uniref:Ectopic P granules protein 5 homolog isoform X2 n=1 Tax=Thrips palmi TaxID=161013 RepID=A0A6P8YIV4_THRPL|nr:ectopic P granules protein 5 homolog isoform X2 [Thrips palmi]